MTEKVTAVCSNAGALVKATPELTQPDDILQAPATRFSKKLQSIQFAQDIATIQDIVADLRKADPSLPAWVNFPLLNGSGDKADFSLSDHVGNGQFTAYALSTPALKAIIEDLQSDGIVVKYARVAALGPWSALRPHIDMYRAMRLVICLAGGSAEHRHVFGSTCIGMGAGEVWGINGSLCHGAANLSRTHERFALLLDVEPTPSCRAWLREAWNMPQSSIVHRPSWTEATRARIFEHARELAEAGRFPEAENEWLMAPFQYRMDLESSLDELLRFATILARTSISMAAREHWQCRAMAIAHPTLPCDVVPPSQRGRGRRRA